MVDMSDTPAGMIARLDAAIARRGQTVTLRKTNTAVGQVTVGGHVRNFKPDEIVGIIQQGDTNVIVSPTGLETFGVPPINGFVVIDGVPRRIVGVTPMKSANTLVRIEIQVSGGG